ncbi:MAG: pirin family protein [Alphaproteobacteria bacterium]|nr:pirin family protein [Alphaproteobacteria bacterium]
MVRRALPAIEARMIGPFIFADEMGPHRFPPGEGIDVRPHPHIGLATVTYLFDGEIVHRDSLGVVQPIRPGDVNWMTAGRGIVHSERTGPELRAKGHSVHGMQTWVALPDADEETEPAFHHHPAASLPLVRKDGLAIRVIAGSFLGETSPVATLSEMLYADLHAREPTTFALPATLLERGLYAAIGDVMIDDETLPTGQLALLKANAAPTLRWKAPGRTMLLGGAPVGNRHIEWNFVARSKERIDRAKAEWRAGAFPKVPGDDEFIPLPASSPR